MSSLSVIVTLKTDYAHKTHTLIIAGLHSVWYSVEDTDDNTTCLEPLGTMPVKAPETWAYADHADWYAGLVDEPTAAARIVAAMVSLMGKDANASDYTGNFSEAQS